MLIDHAQKPGRWLIPPPTRPSGAKPEKAGRSTPRAADGLDSMSVSAPDLAILRSLAADKKFSLRVDNYMDPSGAAECWPRADDRPDGLIRVRGIKLYMDGALARAARRCSSPIATPRAWACN